jgi:hypothetical protein
MRKITKTCDLSTNYYNWEQALEAANENHPEYNSSKGEHYWDIVMNLFRCQKGLCAYTEMFICSPGYYASDKWDADGKYVNPDAPKKPQTSGQLEHFDSALKDDKAWLWKNFFMAESNVNTKIKHMKEVDNILKPDEDEYDEFQLLEYDSTKHIFIANTNLGKAKQDRVNKMIGTLGLNFDPVKERRRMFFKDKLKMIEFNVYTWDNIEIEEFPTAFAMIKAVLS